MDIAEQQRISVAEGKRVFELVRKVRGMCISAQIHDLPIILDVCLQEISRRNDSWCKSLAKMRFDRYFERNK